MTACNSGFAILADGVDVSGTEVARCTVRAGSITGARNRVQVRFRDNNLGGTADADMRLDGASDNELDILSVHTDNNSATNRAVREFNTCDRNEIRLRIKDTASTAHFTSDALLVGAASRVLREPGMDVLDASTLVVGIDARSTTARLSSSTLRPLASSSCSVWPGRLSPGSTRSGCH